MNNNVVAIPGMRKTVESNISYDSEQLEINLYKELRKHRWDRLLLLVPIVKLKNNIMKFKILLVILIDFNFLSKYKMKIKNMRLNGVHCLSTTNHHNGLKILSLEYIFIGSLFIPEFNSEWYPGICI